MNIPFEAISIGAFVVVVIGFVVLAVRARNMERKMAVFLKGKDGKSLEDVLMLVRTEVMSAHRAIQILEKRMAEARARLQGSVQHVGIVRFNPFRDAGGDQSFCIALLDEAHNGVVVSSLYARDGVRVYGKPIAAGVSSYTLSGEEQQAIAKAIQGS